ncbi:hypothetical protein [Paraliomyxa miuraensis]|uniref:hypothetical protein n=1 Tax=Paraliomyxa miuraensis TaxID=376150 RepID=UPI0022553842|nr:hypothetical protein [Paraliomyxa miuraensis]MCX4243342.1 hypothetical protein [Paraliomyxa miuraensis]
MGEVLGTEHPVRVGAVGSDGSWAVICQAREDTDGDGEIAVRQHIVSIEGDQITPYLVLGSGPGHAMPERMASTRDGRWLAFSDSSGVGLVDTAVPSMRRLPPLSTEGPTVLRFSADGTHLVGRFTGVDDEHLEVHRLSDGEHWSVDLGPGVLVGMRMDPAGRAVWLEIAREDTNGDGRINGPRFAIDTLSSMQWACGLSGGLGVMGKGDPHDAVQVHRVDLQPGATLVSEPGGLLALTGGILAREPDGALVLRSPSGVRTVTDATCDGVVAWSDEQGRSAIVACRSHATLLEVHGDGSSEPLGSGEVSRDAESLGGWPALLSVGPGELLSPTTHERVTLPTFDFVMHARPEAVVVRRGGDLVHHRFRGDSRGRGLGPFERWRWIRHAAGEWIVLANGVEARVLSMTTGAERGRVDGEVYGVTTDGRVLLGPARAPRDDSDPMSTWPRGPLRWVAPLDPAMGG